MPPPHRMAVRLAAIYVRPQSAHLCGSVAFVFSHVPTHRVRYGRPDGRPLNTTFTRLQSRDQLRNPTLGNRVGLWATFFTGLTAKMHRLTQLDVTDRQTP